MADITLEQLTTGVVTGDGVFDKLMASVNAQLLEQYKQNRLTGADYANVYLGSMQSAMSQSVAFLLGEQAADKQADLLDQQILQSIAQTNLIEEQTQSEDKQNATDGLIDKQILDLISQTATRDNESVEKVNVLQEQVLKTEAEQNLINQKTLTEEAQTEDVLSNATVVFTPKVVDGEGYEITPAVGLGVVGKQQVLFAKQTDGFQRDAEQKATKILMDSYTIRRSTDSAELPPTKAENTDIDQFIEQLAIGSNVSLTESSFNVGGTVSGLTTTGLILQVAIAGGDPTGNLPISADGTFTFLNPFLDGQTYEVSILSQPDSFTATLQAESGTIDAGNVTNVVVTVA